MKTSDKVLLSAAVAFFAVLTAGILLAGKYASSEKARDPSKAADMPESAVIMTPALGDFTAISIEGAWSTHVRSSTTCTVRAAVPRSMAETVTLTLEGDTLVCRSMQSTPAADESQRPVLEIGLPQLNNLHTQGMNEVFLHKLQAGTLVLNAEGAMSLKGTQTQIDSLICTTQGMGSVSIEGGVRSAHLESQGMGTISLPMQGGSLSGQVSGLTKVKIMGTVSRNTLKPDGAAVIVTGE